jgi:2-hydroxychromene-2-carboxylate isomerase
MWWRHGRSMRAWLEGRVTGLITSPRTRAAGRRIRAGRRLLMGARPTVHWFHGVGDPYSHLGAQLLPRLLDSYDIDVVPHLVPPPEAAAAPEPGRLADWSLRDAARLAEAHRLALPLVTRQPRAESVAAVEAALASVTDPRAFAARALTLGDRLWQGDDPDAPPTGDAGAALAEGRAALTAAGHYLPGVFAFEGECYWGVDRLPHLEARLASFRRIAAPLVRQLEASDETGDARGTELHFYLSFRSPYTHIAAARVRRLAARWNAKLVLRPVLPMVMRGLPVPREKRLYIVRDTKREAERLGIEFGRICDPVGTGVERGYAVLHRAMAQGKGPAFAESFLAGAFAEAVDATTDEGLRMLAARAGLGETDVAAALADESWRQEAESNRAEMVALGLWGVPSFRVAERPPHWGQDRLWAVEQDLKSIAEGRP